MSVAVRDELRRLVDALPEEELEPARDALTELLRRASDSATEDIEAKVDRRMIEVGIMEAVPRREDILNRPKTSRPRLSGKPASQTIIEGRR
ncbi:MAG: hypothetical protein ABGY41_10205 [Candidatus Poribacteria bacterium]